LTHCDRLAASRAAWTAGKSSAIRTEMMAITTSNSMSVKPRLRDLMMIPSVHATAETARRGRISAER